MEVSHSLVYVVNVDGKMEHYSRDESKNLVELLSKFQIQIAIGNNRVNELKIKQWVHDDDIPF